MGRLQKKKILSISLVIILLISGVPFIFELGSEHSSLIAGTTLFVGGTGPGNYSNIQEAINNASENETIRVFDGIYNGNLIVNKSVKLIGNGSTNTIINGSGFGDVIEITVSWVNVSNFTITNSGTSFNDAGISMKNVQNCSLYNNNFSNNRKDFYLINSVNNTIANNICNSLIYLERSTSNMIKNNICGIRLWLYSSNNILINNTCFYSGGIYLGYSSYNIIENNYCNLNTNGIYLERNSVNNLIINNNCSNNHNGIYSEDSPGNTFMNNTCSNNNNVGIYLRNGEDHVVINNTCNMNNWTGLGGGINCTIIGNTCNYNKGKGIGCGDKNVIDNNTCLYNGEYGLNCGDLNIITNNTCNWNNQFGMYFVHSGANTIMYNDCSNNQINGIQVLLSSQNTIKNNTYDSNMGIGIYVHRSTNNSIENCIVSNNNEGIQLDKSRMIFIRNCNIYNNVEGIRLDNISYADFILNCRIYSNTVGIYFEDKSNASVNYNKIYGNTNYGIRNTDTSRIINADYNWWGDVSGPYDPSDDRATGGMYNPLGTGDTVSDHVIYRPWGLKNYDPTIDVDDILYAKEDSFYERSYAATDDNGDDITWSVSSNTSWLKWGNNNHTIYGTPKNNDVGKFWVRVNITDPYGGSDEHYFILTINNRLPKILTDNLLTATEGQYYSNDYNSDDDNQGNITWILNTNAKWLVLDNITGILNGTPMDKDVGQYWVNVTVDDGNGGKVSTNFTLNVNNINNAPFIITEDVLSINEDEYYEVVYSAFDNDNSDSLIWHFDSDARWLQWDSTKTTLYGTPRNEDVGDHLVRIVISDGHDGYDEHSFTITVINTNDAPTINTEDVIETDEDSYYQVAYSATDVDLGDVLFWTYEDDADWLNWGSNNHTLYGTPGNEHVGSYQVRINITDGNYGYDEHSFILTVNNINDAPTITGAPEKLELYPQEDYVLDLASNIKDIDNDKKDLKLNIDSEYTSIIDLKIIFNYPDSIYNETVTITVSDGIESSNPHVITIIIKDIIKPSIIKRSPNGSNVSISTNITITFSEPMNKSTVQNAFSISPDVKGDFRWQNNKMIFQPRTNLQYNTNYLITISRTATDYAHNMLEDSYNWNFTTIQEFDGNKKPDHDQEDKSSNSIWLIIIIVLLVIIITPLFLWLVLRQKKNKINNSNVEKNEMAEKEKVINPHTNEYQKSEQKKEQFSQQQPSHSPYPTQQYEFEKQKEMIKIKDHNDEIEWEDV